MFSGFSLITRDIYAYQLHVPVLQERPFLCYILFCIIVRVISYITLNDS